jgi:antiviral immunity YobI-like NTPase
MTMSQKDKTFIDLTPIDDAEIDKGYEEALSFALRNYRIKNIAITGPYGSGKSSIIRTFEKNSHLKFLNISLANFDEKSDKSQLGEDQNNKTNPIPITLIERSILQQMLYGADANKLPYSRFKRIVIPKNPIFKLMLIALWSLASLFLYHYNILFLDLEYFSGMWILGIVTIVLILALPVLLISDAYKSSYGFSLKKLSLKNMEIERGDVSEKSILNRHLDEIIYFFQVTDYDVVVIEDLDRFGSPEIFVKLREINKLVNDNEQINRNIKFLYALRDDMFAHKKRTKFFDFIIPIVPIVNSTNSLEIMRRRLNGKTFAKKIKVQFLREVSLYIDDMRLINNIFNEFHIYHEQLKSDSFDETKLLAMIIYKNVYPNDFERLHYCKGAFCAICNKKTELQVKIKSQIESKINEFRDSLDEANNDDVRNIQELINIYLGHIITNAPSSNHFSGIVCKDKHIPFSKFTTFESFEPVINEEKIELATQGISNLSHRIPTGKSFVDIEKEINANETFLQRKEKIENKSAKRQKQLHTEIKSLEEQLILTTQLPMHQLLQQNDIVIEESFEKWELSDNELLVYLIKNGYLDEHYNIYISIFHKGSLTPLDNDYLRTIRNFNQPDPLQSIDTPAEICIYMRPEDFAYKYVLNVF